MLEITAIYSAFDAARRVARLCQKIGVLETFRAMRIFNVVKPYTMVGVKRLQALHILAVEIEKNAIPGDVVECGTCNGGTAAVLGAAIFLKIRRITRRLWLFDSFQGLPAPVECDGPRAKSYQGKLVANIGNVKEVLKKVGVPEMGVRIVPGWFQDSFQKVDIPSIALLHIDADWYESVKLSLERFYPAVSSGGFIVFDDYGFWEGCKKATDEFLAKLPHPPRLMTIDSRARYIQKP